MLDALFRLKGGVDAGGGGSCCQISMGSRLSRRCDSTSSGRSIAGRFLGASICLLSITNRTAISGLGAASDRRSRTAVETRLLRLWLSLVEARTLRGALLIHRGVNCLLLLPQIALVSDNGILLNEWEQSRPRVFVTLFDEVVVIGVDEVRKSWSFCQGHRRRFSIVCGAPRTSSAKGAASSRRIDFKLTDNALSFTVGSGEQNLVRHFAVVFDLFYI